MFNLFRWSSNNNEVTSIPPPPPLPSLSPPAPPTPPPSPYLSMPGIVSNNAQSFDVISTLQRIESKLDILLTKIDSNGNQRKKFIIKEQNETNNTDDTTKSETSTKKYTNPRILSMNS